ncbi:MAG TPA: hypothetical protein VHO26_08770 [Propionibacteriaceae bacterium]|nr:hypothetical protein [Propionibacteriaceae bacterium]
MAPRPPVIRMVDGVPVRLREELDLGFLSRWGRVFRVFDLQDSGSLCVGLEGRAGRLFVKYAGALTVRYEGRIEDAVASLRDAAGRYRALAHPTLLPLLESVDIGSHGHALVFPWSDAVCIGRQYGLRGVLERLAPARRAAAVQQLLDFHAEAARRGWVAVDLYDGSVLVDPASGRVTVCDIDVYQRAPHVNRMGRMWGSSRFMSPEEFELGATIDEVTTVHTLGVLAHSLLGDDGTRSRDAWVGSDDQFAIARRAALADRSDRWPSIGEMAAAWRATLLPEDADPSQP